MRIEPGFGTPEEDNKEDKQKKELDPTKHLYRAGEI
jgi:hypothetical protein